MKHKLCSCGGRWSPCVIFDRNIVEFPFMANVCLNCETPQFEWKYFVGRAKNMGHEKRRRECAEFLNIAIDDRFVGTALADTIIVSTPSLN
jgi:hypothetical protein